MAAEHEQRPSGCYGTKALGPPRTPRRSHAAVAGSTASGNIWLFGETATGPPPTPTSSTTSGRFEDVAATSRKREHGVSLVMNRVPLRP